MAVKQSGIFSDKIYHPKIYHTGGHGGRQKLHKEKFELDLDKLHIQREEEEILPIILAITSEI